MLMLYERSERQLPTLYVCPVENVHMTGDRVRILLLMLPFVFRDLIAPEVRHVYPIIQYLEHLYSDLGDEIDHEKPDQMKSESWLAKNDSISCELGISYPVLQSILSGRNHQTTR